VCYFSHLNSISLPFFCFDCIILRCLPHVEAFESREVCKKLEACGQWPGWTRDDEGRECLL